jgi:hypothetical protein
MRMPSKGVLIRLAIYLPIIGFLAWRAFAPSEPEPQPAPEAQEMPTRTFTTEDGKKIEVIQVTPEQAQKMMGRPMPSPDEAEAKAEQKADVAEPPTLE